MNVTLVSVLSGGFGVFLVGQAILLVWHLSRISTTLNFIAGDLEEFKKINHERQNDIKELWEKVDELSNGVLAIRAIQEKCEHK